MFKFTEFLKRDNIQRTIYLVLHAINSSNGEKLIVVDYETKEEITEFLIEVILEDFNFQDIPDKDLKEMIKSELQMMIDDKIINIDDFVLKLKKYSNKIPFNSNLIMDSILNYTNCIMDENKVKDINMDMVNSNNYLEKFSNKYSIISQENDNDDFAQILLYTTIIVEKHIPKLNSILDLNFENIALDLRVGSQFSSHLHNRSYLGCAKASDDSSDIEIVLNPKEMYYQNLGGNVFPIDILAFEHELILTLAHEFRHVWQYYNNFDFSDSSVDYLDKKEEIDARLFSKEYLSKYINTNSTTNK